MTTENRNNHKSSALVILFILVVTMCACNFPLLSGSTTTDTPSQSNDPQESPESSNAPDCLDGIQPGKTTRSEVISMLGEPVGIDNSSGMDVMVYDSGIPGQFNSVALVNETVAMVNAILSESDSTKWSEIQEKYGEPAHTAFSNYLQGAMTYSYPDKGLAFVADPSMNVVFINKCFTPMSLDDYLKTWGASLPKEDPYIK